MSAAVITVRCHFDGKSLIPDEPVDLPTDQPLVAQVTPQISGEIIDNVPIDAPRPQSALEWMIQHPIDDPSLPADLSDQLDHYLYGTSKRE
jgi:hypothetical protein